MKLGEIIRGIDKISIQGDTSVEITDITKDSRNVSEGSLFFAAGTGRAFIDDALRRGARAAVTDSPTEGPFACIVRVGNIAKALGQAASKFHGHPSRKMHVTGITGTNGKTTTTYLMESILKAAGKRPGVIGTISHRFGGRIVKAENTTPGAGEINRLLDDMVRSGTTHVVMEVSSHALDQRRVEGIDFDTAVFTNLTHDHLDYHGDFDSYRAAKKLLFEDYLMRSRKKKRCAIMNIDDPSIREFAIGQPVKTLSYSIKGFADACLSDWSEGIHGLTLTISLQGKKIPIASPLIGMFNASNILAATLSGHVAGIPHSVIREGVERLDGVPGRLERVKNDRGIFAFVDYAHTPDALASVLTLLGRLKKGRLIVVFGCGGNRDTTKRPVMGAIASSIADHVIVTSDNPRGEDPLRIIDDISKGFDGKPFKAIENRREAILESIRMARQDDVVLVAGKGHEDYQIIGDRTFHFSDREVIEEFLNVAT